MDGTSPRQVHANRDARWTYIAYSISNYDGDTVTVMFDKGDEDYSRKRVRVQYVDTPEMNDEDPAVRELARAAKGFTADWLAAAAQMGYEPGRPKAEREYPLTLVTWFDKHSINRIIAVIENLAGESLADALLAAGHGVPTDERGKRI